MFNTFLKILIFSQLFDTIITLRVRTPLIFGRRMGQTMAQNDTNLRTSLQRSNIVFDIIDNFPLNKVKVSYGNGVDVELGNQLTPLSVEDEPSVQWPTDGREYYTLMMLDLDAHNRNGPLKHEFKNWLVVNIPGSDITKGQTLAVYRGPIPMKGSGLHRIVFLIYKQDGLITHSENVLNSTSREGRTNFNARVFAKTYKLGHPMSANFFLTQYDDYVPLLRAKNKKLKAQPLPQLKAQPLPQLKAVSRLSHKRAQLLDWAPRKPKAPKFPQMICISYETYQRLQQLIDQNKQNNTIH